MSRWTHCICAACYAKHEPEREPVKMKDAERESCCFCGAMTSDGIYYRANPEHTRCAGKCSH